MISGILLFHQEVDLVLNEVKSFLAVQLISRIRLLFVTGSFINGKSEKKMWGFVVIYGGLVGP